MAPWNFGRKAPTREETEAFLYPNGKPKPTPPPKPKFAVGDTVMLKSGGPDMTVVYRTNAYDGSGEAWFYECAWMDGSNHLQKHDFHEEVLK